jgi:phosphatidylglycerophosphate synthase
MRTWALVWWLGLCAVMVGSGAWWVLLFVACALVAAAVRHLMGEGQCHHRAGVTENGYSAESR